MQSTRRTVRTGAKPAPPAALSEAARVCSTSTSTSTSPRKRAQAAHPLPPTSKRVIGNGAAVSRGPRTSPVADAASRALVEQYWESVRQSSREPPLYHTLSDRYGGTRGIPYASLREARTGTKDTNAHSRARDTVAGCMEAAQTAIHACRLDDAVSLLHAALTRLQNTDGGLSMEELAASACMLDTEATAQIHEQRHVYPPSSSRVARNRDNNSCPCVHECSNRRGANKVTNEKSAGWVDQDRRGAYTGEALRCLAKVDILRGRYAEALRHLIMSSAADPLPSETYALCAACYEALGKPHMAHVEYEKYMKLSAPSLEILAHCGKCAAESGSYDAAEGYLQQLLHRISLSHEMGGEEEEAVHSAAAAAASSSLQAQGRCLRGDEMEGACVAHDGAAATSPRPHLREEPTPDDKPTMPLIATHASFYAAHAHFYLGVICEARMRAIQQSETLCDGRDGEGGVSIDALRCDDGRMADPGCRISSTHHLHHHHLPSSHTHDDKEDESEANCTAGANSTGSNHAPHGSGTSSQSSKMSLPRTTDSDDAIVRMQAEAAAHYRRAVSHSGFVRAYEQAAESAMRAGDYALASSLLQSLQRMRPAHAHYASQLAEVCAHCGDVAGQLSALSAALDRRQSIAQRRKTRLQRGDLYRHALHDISAAIADYTLVIHEAPPRASGCGGGDDDPDDEDDGCTLLAFMRRGDAFHARRQSREDAAAALRDFRSFLRAYKSGPWSRRSRDGLPRCSPGHEPAGRHVCGSYSPLKSSLTLQTAGAHNSPSALPLLKNGTYANENNKEEDEGCVYDMGSLGVTQEELEKDVTRAILALALGAYDAGQFTDSAEYFAQAIARGWRPAVALPVSGRHTDAEPVRRRAESSAAIAGDARVGCHDDVAYEAASSAATEESDVMHKMYIALAHHVMQEYPIQEDMYRTTYEPREWLFPPDTRRLPRANDKRDADRPLSNASCAPATPSTPSLACLVVETRYGVLRALEPTMWSSLESAFLDLWEPYHAELERIREETATRPTGRRGKRYGQV